jgi:hypothetical protein
VMDLWEELHWRCMEDFEEVEEGGRQGDHDAVGTQVPRFAPWTGWSGLVGDANGVRPSTTGLLVPGGGASTD